ncbi:MAG TPA: manganese catalase family protein [Abditibacterium sp.]
MHDAHLAYPVRVEKPNPLFAKMLQQAIGGVEGEIRVMMQYLFQGFGNRGPLKYRNMLISTGTEEIGHIEMLATAIALNLEGAPTSLKEEMASHGIAGAVMNGHSLNDLLPRQLLSAGMAATPEDSNGTPFDCSHVYASGNLVADMYANVAAESSGRVLAARLWEMTDDPGMKDMLSFLIARDTMHQQQWLAVIEELEMPLPVPSDLPTNAENTEFSNKYFVHSNGPIPLDSRFLQGPSLDGRGGTFEPFPAVPLGQIPTLAPPVPQSHSKVMVKPNFQADGLTAPDQAMGLQESAAESAL